MSFQCMLEVAVVHVLPQAFHTRGPAAEKLQSVAEAVVCA